MQFSLFSIKVEVYSSVLRYVFVEPLKYCVFFFKYSLILFLSASPKGKRTGSIALTQKVNKKARAQ